MPTSGSPTADSSWSLRSLRAVRRPTRSSRTVSVTLLEQLYTLLDTVGRLCAVTRTTRRPRVSARRRQDARCTPVGRRSIATTSPIRTRSPPRCATSTRSSTCPELGHVVVTTMADIETVFMNPDVFASTNVQDPIFPLSPEAAAVLAADDFDPIAVMSNRPEPDHGRIRVYTRQGFSHRRLNALEDYIRAACHRAARPDDRPWRRPPSTSPRWRSPCPPRPCSASSGSRRRTTR